MKYLTADNVYAAANATFAFIPTAVAAFLVLGTTEYTISLCSPGSGDSLPLLR